MEAFERSFKCCVPNCNSRVDAESDKLITFHLFPSKTRLREKWTDTIRKFTGVVDFEVFDESTICSEHFDVKEDFLYESEERKLKFNAVPRYSSIAATLLSQKRRKRRSKVVAKAIVLDDVEHAVSDCVVKIEPLDPDVLENIKEEGYTSVLPFMSHLEVVSKQRATMKMVPRRWKCEEIKKLVDFWRNHPELWDTKDENFRNVGAKKIALKEIQKGMIHFGVDEIHRKLKILRIVFRRHLNDLKKSFESPQRKVKKPWKFFESLMFLRDHSNLKDNHRESFRSQDKDSDTPYIQVKEEIDADGERVTIVKSEDYQPIRRCAVSWCHNEDTPELQDNQITFHSFPLDNSSLCIEWAQAVNVPGWWPDTHSLICSAHFKKRDFFRRRNGVRVLKSNSKPIINVRKRAVEKIGRPRKPRESGAVKRAGSETETASSDSRVDSDIDESPRKVMRTNIWEDEDRREDEIKTTVRKDHNYVRLLEKFEYTAKEPISAKKRKLSSKISSAKTLQSKSSEIAQQSKSSDTEQPTNPSDITQQTIVTSTDEPQQSSVDCESAKPETTNRKKSSEIVSGQPPKRARKILATTISFVLDEVYRQKLISDECMEMLMPFRDLPYEIFDDDARDKNGENYEKVYELTNILYQYSPEGYGYIKQVLPLPKIAIEPRKESTKQATSGSGKESNTSTTRFKSILPMPASKKNMEKPVSLADCKFVSTLTILLEEAHNKKLLTDECMKLIEPYKDLSAEAFIGNGGQVSDRVAAFASLLFVNSPETYKFVEKVLPLPKVIVKSNTVTGNLGSTTHIGLVAQMARTTAKESSPSSKRAGTGSHTSSTKVTGSKGDVEKFPASSSIHSLMLEAKKHVTSFSYELLQAIGPFNEMTVADFTSEDPSTKHQVQSFADALHFFSPQGYDYFKIPLNLPPPNWDNTPRPMLLAENKSNKNGSGNMHTRVESPMTSLLKKHQMTKSSSCLRDSATTSSADLETVMQDEAQAFLEQLDTSIKGQKVPTGRNRSASLGSPDPAVNGKLQSNIGSNLPTGVLRYTFPDVDGKGSTTEVLQDSHHFTYTKCPHTGRPILKLEIDTEGFMPKDLIVKTTGRLLTISGKRQKIVAGCKSTSEFCRKINLPNNVIPEMLTCKFVNGRMFIEAPGKTEEQTVSPSEEATVKLDEQIEESKPPKPNGDMADIGSNMSNPLNTPLNTPVMVYKDQNECYLSLIVEIGKFFKPGDVVVKVRGHQTIIILAEVSEDGPKSRLKARLEREFDLPQKIDRNTLKAGCTDDGLLKIIAKVV